MYFLTVHTHSFFTKYVMGKYITNRPSQKENVYIHYYLKKYKITINPLANQLKF